MKCKICHTNETDNTSGICNECLGKENWEKELKNLKLSGWYLEGTEIPVEMVDFIEKLLRQEREKWERRFLDELEKWIGVDNLPKFLEKLKNEKQKRIINKRKIKRTYCQKH
jgi:hypothetical protein